MNLISNKEYIRQNDKLREAITRLFKRIEAGEIKCRCGGTLKAQVQSEGRSTSEWVRLHCSRKRCSISTNWCNGSQLLRAFKEWKQAQRRKL